MNIFRLFSPDTTRSWSQSASASCSGFMCRATASNVIAPTAADQVAGMLALALAGGVVIVGVYVVGLVVGWW